MNLVSWKPLDEFNRLTCYGTASEIRKFIENYFAKNFKERVPFGKINIELIKLRIEYDIAINIYKSAGKQVPQRIMQNYEASSDYNIDGLTEGMRELVRLRVQHAR